MSKMGSVVDVALEDRDPNNLNQHLQIVWDDIVGEPEGARSPECAWRASTLVFRNARNGCYTVLTVLLSIPAALLLGCCFACVAFEQVWCTAPCLRVLKICCASTRTSVRTVVAALVTPVAESVGHTFRHIRYQQHPEGLEEKDVLLV